MENRKIITSGKMTTHLILSWFVWGLVFGILSNVNIKIPVAGAIIEIILGVVGIILSWICAVTTNFRKNTVSCDDIPKIIKNLAIFVIIFSIIVDVVSGTITTAHIITTIISLVISLAINLAALPIVKKYMLKRSAPQQTEQKQ